MNLEQARFNMIEQQIRTWEVLDQDVLDLLYVVRREEFVPAEYRAFAFSDLDIPLYEGAGEGERMRLTTSSCSPARRRFCRRHWSCSSRYEGGFSR